MGDVPFHLTVMGRRFYEYTMPAIVEAIERLNANLERAPRQPQDHATMQPNSTKKPVATATPVDPALVDAPCAESLVDPLTDEISPALAQMLAKANAAEDAYNTTKAIREGFDHNEAEEGWANLRYYLENAVREIRRIVQAQR